MSFLLMLVGFLEKMDEIRNFGQFWGPMPRRRNPTQQRKSTSQGVACPHHGATEREAWTSLGYYASAKAYVVA